MSIDPASYAAYFNVARHNLLLALNHVAHKSGIQQVENDDQVANHPVLVQLAQWAKLQEAGENISDKDIRVVKQLVNGLQKALPVLSDEFIQAISGQKINIEYMAARADRSRQPATQERDRKSPAEKAIRTWRMADLHWALDMLVKTLMAQRNYFSHAYQTPVVFKSKSAVTNLLGIWFDAARREAKSRFEFLEHEVKDLLRHDPDTKKEDPNALHALTRAENGAYQLTDKGAAFFCCLFLDKQQGNEFLKQIPGFKYDAERPYQAILRTYTHWSIRLPFVRIDTDNTAQSLGLDMLNELARCPVEIYEQLSPEQQKAFEVKPETDVVTDVDTDEGMATRFVRHGDRFAPLVMSCFDHLASANAQHDTGIRFLLDLGDFYFAAYPKKMPDGSTDVRRLKQKVLRFGHLSQALAQAAQKPEAWNVLERVSTERDFDQPYIVQSRPHYHLSDEGSIPIKLKAHCSANLYTPPQRDPLQADRFEELPSERPDFWLSPYELVNLAFYQHLRVRHALPENQYPKVDNLLSAYQSSLRRLYENMQTQPDAWYSANKEALAIKLQRFCHETGAKTFYTLCPQDLPGELQALLLNKAKAPETRMLEFGKNTLQLLIDEGDTRLQDVQRAKQSLNERIKPGKPSHRVLRAGDMATYLAKDILRLQPVQDESSDHKGKPTSIMSDLLQARLAYFGREKTSLPALFNSLRLTGQAEVSKNHPFLQGIRLDAPGMNGIAQFYEAYLRERQAHLKQLQSQLQQDPASLQSPALAWLHLAKMPERLQDNNNLPALMRRYLKRLADQEPLNLPRGLFRELTVKALLNLGNAALHAEVQAELDKEAARGRFTSPSILVALYFSHVQGDASQDFYYLHLSKREKLNDAINGADWRHTQWVEHAVERLCKANPRLKGRALEEALAAERADRSKQLRSKVLDQDRALNHRATQDQVLFLATRQLMDLNDVKAKSKAGDNAAANMLEKLKLQTLQREDLNAMVPHEVRVAGKTIYAEAIKAKNTGKFKSLSRDRRLPGLLHYYPAERIHVSAITHELQAYPHAQNQAFKEVLGFETRHNQRQKLQANDKVVAKTSLHRVLVEQYFKQYPQSTDDPQRLQAEALTLRNAFCHNQTPEPSNVKDAAAHPMLLVAHDTLAPKRQEPKDIAHVKDGQSVAQYFADALSTRYQHMQKAPKP
jgi:hypothetical protein